MKKDADFSERVKKVIEYLNVTPNTFGQILGYNRSQTIYDLLNNKCNPSFDFVKKFMISEISENINPDWLLTGRGEMLRGTEGITPCDGQPSTSLPYLPFNTLATYFTQPSNALASVSEHYLVPIFHQATFLTNVVGSSMLPTYAAGDIIACRQLSASSFIQWNNVHLILTEQGTLLRRIKKGATPSTVTLTSDNPAYDPIELPISQLTHIAIVVGFIRTE